MRAFFCGKTAHAVYRKKKMRQNQRKGRAERRGRKEARYGTLQHGAAYGKNGRRENAGHRHKRKTRMRHVRGCGGRRGGNRRILRGAYPDGRISGKKRGNSVHRARAERGRKCLRVRKQVRGVCRGKRREVALRRKRSRRRGRKRNRIFRGRGCVPCAVQPGVRILRRRPTGIRGGRILQSPDRSPVYSLHGFRRSKRRKRNKKIP